MLKFIPLFLVLVACMPMMNGGPVLQCYSKEVECVLDVEGVSIRLPVDEERFLEVITREGFEYVTVGRQGDEPVPSIINQKYTEDVSDPYGYLIWKEPGSGYVYVSYLLMADNTGAIVYFQEFRSSANHY